MVSCTLGSTCGLSCYGSATVVSTMTGGTLAPLVPIIADGIPSCTSGCIITCTWTSSGEPVLADHLFVLSDVSALARFSLGRYNKAFATAAVFIVSAIVHEQIIACAMGTRAISGCACGRSCCGNRVSDVGFFYPVLLLMFGGPGVFFVNLTKKNTRFYNVFMWLMLSVGNALLMVLYSREWFARFGEHPVNYPVRCCCIQGFSRFVIGRVCVVPWMAGNGLWLADVCATLLLGILPGFWQALGLSTRCFCVCVCKV
jgi:hypothetical protein